MKNISCAVLVRYLIKHIDDLNMPPLVHSSKYAWKKISFLSCSKAMSSFSFYVFQQGYQFCFKLKQSLQKKMKFSVKNFYSQCEQIYSQSVYNLCRLLISALIKRRKVFTDSVAIKTFLNLGIFIRHVKMLSKSTTNYQGIVVQSLLLNLIPVLTEQVLKISVFKLVLWFHEVFLRNIKILQMILLAHECNSNQNF